LLAAREHWGRLFVTSLVRKHNILFDSDFSFGEYTVFSVRYLKFSHSFSVLDILDYYYRVNYLPDSLSKSISPKLFRDMEKTEEIIGVIFSELFSDYSHQEYQRRIEEFLSYKFLLVLY